MDIYIYIYMHTDMYIIIYVYNSLVEYMDIYIISRRTIYIYICILSINHEVLPVILWVSHCQGKPGAAPPCGTSQRCDV